MAKPNLNIYHEQEYRTHQHTKHGVITALISNIILIALYYVPQINQYLHYHEYAMMLGIILVVFNMFAAVYYLLRYWANDDEPLNSTDDIRPHYFKIGHYLIPGAVIFLDRNNADYSFKEFTHGKLTVDEYKNDIKNNRYRVLIVNADGSEVKYYRRLSEFKYDDKNVKQLRALSEVNN